MTVAPEKKSNIETVHLPPERARLAYTSLDTEDLKRATNAMQTAFDELLHEDAGLAEIFSKIVEAKAKVAVFGGWARDRLFEVLHGQTAPSRDIDFVVDSPQSIAGFFPAGAKTNPFGGVVIKGARVPLEAWSLKETFLFKLRGDIATFEALPATADYDVNAILFFPAQCNGHASVLDAGAGHQYPLEVGLLVHSGRNFRSLAKARNLVGIAAIPREVAARVGAGRPNPMSDPCYPTISEVSTT